MELPESKNHHTTPFEPPVDSRTAAAAVGIHYKVLERMARKRKVPATKIGRSWAFRLSVLSDWLDQRMRSNSKDQANEKPKKENHGNEHAEHSSNNKSPGW